MSDIKQPETIGKYLVQGTLGEGSMGTVYKALDPEIQRTVAIKVIRSIPSHPYMDEKSCLERFKVEARAAGNLRHKNIITIFEVNTEVQPPYLVMDHIDGVSLESLIHNNLKLDPYDVMYYLFQIANGLDYAHEKKIIHRDIKPSNILIDSSSEAYILDFGVATVSGSARIDINYEDPVMGSPAYMAPEQILNEELDGRADIFSLAIVAYECLTGRRPYDGENFTVVAKHIIKGSRHSLLEFLPQFPLQLEAEFEKALSNRKTDRFRSARTMILVFCDALGIKDPMGGTSKMRRYKYRIGGDSVSDRFEDLSLAPKLELKLPTPDVRLEKFGRMKPVTQKSIIRKLIGILLIIVGLGVIFYTLKFAELF